MARQNVHLSADLETAVRVGRRKGRRPVVLKIDAAAAHASGIAFYHGNDSIWLADRIPATFIAAFEAN